MKYKFNISNLDCVNCANKIEVALNKDKNIKNASINFSSLKLTVETDITKDVLKYVNNIVKKVEPDTTIYDKEVKEENIKSKVIVLIIGTIIGIIGLLLPNIIGKLFVVISYILLLYKTFIKAIKLLIKEKTLNENFLITISCLGAYFIDKQSEGLMVIVLYEIGKILEGIAVNNSRKSISSLMNIKPLTATLKTTDGNVEVPPEEIKVGDTIIVKIGQRIPLDGVVKVGSAKVNTSAITGESVLRKIKVDEQALSGMIVEEGLLEINVNKDYENSTVNKILELVENASTNKAKTETFVNKAAKIYTPLVFMLAILLILYGVIFTNVPFNNWFYKALVFLVISCPCAIAISVPLSYFAGIGVSSKTGILIKGSNYLDTLKNLDRIVFDKTGTITTGKFDSININIIDKNYKEKDVEKIIYKGESLSNHPIGKSIVKLLNCSYNSDDVKDFKEIKGNGITFKLDNKEIKIGNYKLCNTKDVGAICYLSIDEKLIANIAITDKIKDSAKNTIDNLKKRGIKCEILTGDSKENSLKISKKLDIDVKYELLPEDKYNAVNEYIKNNEIVAFVGDGINDSPTLALSHIGISMGGIGSDAAIESSDVVIMTDELNKIIDAIDISRFTNKIIKENLIFAIGIKVLVLILSALGIASMWQAVFADVGVTLLTILNSLRILKRK